MNDNHGASPSHCVDNQVTPSSSVCDRLWNNNLMQHIFADLLVSNPLLKRYESHERTGSNKTTSQNYSSSSVASSNTTDFILRLDDGDLKVHKLLLVTSSSYFRCMLSTNCEEQADGAVSLPNIKSDILFVLLKYIYTGTADLNNENMLEVWQMADYFEILPLVKLSSHFAKVHLCPENSLLVYQQADMHQYHDLAWHALSMASKTLSDIVEKVPHHLKDLSTSTMQAIRRHTNVSFDIPLLLIFIKALQLWCQYDPSRYQHISRILTIAELCVLANKFPEMAAHLSLHPEASLQEDHEQRDSFHDLLIQSSLSYQQVVIAFGGQHNGTIMKCGEAYNPDCHYLSVESSRRFGNAHDWTFAYLTTDVREAIQYGQHLEKCKCRMFLPNKSLMRSSRSEQEAQENKTLLDQSKGFSSSDETKEQESISARATTADGGPRLSADMVTNGTAARPAQDQQGFPQSLVGNERENEITSHQSVVDIENLTYGIGDVKLDKIVSDAFRKRFVIIDKYLIAPFGEHLCSTGSRAKIRRVIKECQGVMNGAVASFVESNKIVVLGGRHACGPVSTVQQYCTDTNSWSLLPPLPTPVYGGAAAVINRVLYYVAGAAPAPEGAEGHAKINEKVFRRGNKNNLEHDFKITYQVGGSSWPNSTKYLNTLWRLKPGSDRWEALCPLPGDGRCHVAAAVLDDALVVTGGLTRDASSSWPGVGGSEDAARCWRYEPSTDEWTRLGNLRQGRAYHGAAVACHKLYVMGGKSGATWLSSVERYDPATDSWVHVPDMITPRSEFGVTVRAEDIFVMGGFTGHKATNQVECYRAASQSWQPRPNMRLDRVGPVAATVRTLCWS